MKGLEALHHPRIELVKIDISAEGKHDIAYMPFYKTKQYDTIEKELKDYEQLKKVVEVLKSKVKFEVMDKDLFGFNRNRLVVNKDIFGSVSLTPEEYELLKEWLK